MKKKTVSEMTSAGAVAAVPMNMNSGAPIKRESAPAKPKKKKSWRNSLHETAVSEAELSEQDLILTPGIGRKLKPGLMRNQLPHEAREMAMGDLLQCMRNSKRILSMLDDDESANIEPWVQEKLVKASDYLNTVCEYIEGQITFKGDDHGTDVLTFEQGAINEVSPDLLLRARDSAVKKHNASSDNQTALDVYSRQANKFNKAAGDKIEQLQQKGYDKLAATAMGLLKGAVSDVLVRKELIRKFPNIVTSSNARTVLNVIKNNPENTAYKLYLALENPQSQVNTQMSEEKQGVSEGTAVPWQDVINALASGYPDLDPADSLAPIMDKYGVKFDDLNRLARRNGYNDIYDVLDKFGGDQGVAEGSKKSISEETNSGNINNQEIKVGDTVQGKKRDGEQYRGVVRKIYRDPHVPNIPLASIDILSGWSITSAVSELKLDNNRYQNVAEGKTGPGLWANINAKRERIKSGSGERMRKPGSKGAPTDASIKAARGVKENSAEDFDAKSAKEQIWGLYLDGNLAALYFNNPALAMNNLNSMETNKENAKIKPIKPDALENEIEKSRQAAINKAQKIQEIAPAIAAVGTTLGRAALSTAARMGAEKIKDKFSDDEDKTSVVESVQQRATRILSALKAAHKSGSGYSLIAESQSFELEHAEVELLLRNYRAALQTLPEATAIKMFGHVRNIKEMLGESDKREQRWQKELTDREHAKHQLPAHILRQIERNPELRADIMAAYKRETEKKSDEKKKTPVKETRLSLESWEASLDSKVVEALNRVTSPSKVAESKKLVNPYAVGMAAAKKEAGIKTVGKPVPKSVVKKGHKVAKAIEKDQK